MITESNSFRINYGTYLAYIRHYRYRKTWGYRGVIIATLGALLAFWLYFQSTFHTSRATGTLAIMAVLAVYYFVLLDILFPIWGFWSAKRRGAYLHDCRIYIDESNVWTTSEDGEIKKPWKSIDCVVSTRKHIFIYFNKSAAFLIPKTAFDTIENAEAFSQTAKRFLAASKKSLS